MSRPSDAAPEALPIRDALRRVRFRVEARLARGRMTVGQLLDLGPGSVVRSGSPAAARISLCVGKVELASGEPESEAGSLGVRLDTVGGGGRE